MIESVSAKKHPSNSVPNNNFGKVGAVLLFAVAAAVGCSDAEVASRNLSQAADNFEIKRRIVFYNGITDTIMAEIVGYCSLDIDTPKVAKVTCKTPKGEFEKHYLGLSDNVTFFATQIDPALVSANQYRVTLKPQTIVPDFDLRGNSRELVEPAIRPTRAEGNGASIAPTGNGALIAPKQ